MGLSLVAIGIIDLWLLINAFKSHFHFDSNNESYDSIAGYGLGGPSIALFGRVGGGYLHEAADVGADLSGKKVYFKQALASNTVP